MTASYPIEWRAADSDDPSVKVEDMESVSIESYSMFCRMSKPGQLRPYLNSLVASGVNVSF